MPYKSKAQAGYFHTHEKQLGKSVVKEFDKASKGVSLPDRVIKEATKDNVNKVRTAAVKTIMRHV